MKRTVLLPLILVGLGLVSTNKTSAQSLPTAQPKRLTIVREEVKVGRAAEHAKHESGWPAAYEKAKSPDYYLAMTSLTGPSEAWYIVPWDSNAAEADSIKREDKDPALSAEVSRLALADAQYINSTRTIQAVARTELSVGEFPDLNKARFFEITLFRVHAGHEAQFEEAAKAYGAARMRAEPKIGYRVYSVTAGMPIPTYLVFSTVEGYAEFDQHFAADVATMKAATPEEMTLLQKFGAEGIISQEVNRFRLDPVQSYVSKEVREKDPEFWTAK